MYALWFRLAERALGLIPGVVWDILLGKPEHFDYESTTTPEWFPPDYRLENRDMTDAEVMEIWHEIIKQDAREREWRS